MFVSKNIAKIKDMSMAGINEFGANNFGNYGNNINKVGQKAQNLKQQGVANNQAETLNFKKTEAADGFFKSTTTQKAEQKESADNDKDQKELKKKDKSGKKRKKSYGDYLNKHLDKLGGGENLTMHNSPEAAAAGAVIVAFFDWAIHGFQ